jgi:hypothetical protein
MNKELLFGLATVLTVVTAGHPNSARAASAGVSFKEDVFPILKG